MDDGLDRPSRPDLPKYVVEPIERQSPERLETIADYAAELAAWKRAKRDREAAERRADDEIDEDRKESLEERGVSTDPGDYPDVPPNAYVTVKETKPGYSYYYWQWREGPNSWGNEYIAPVSPRET